MYFPVTQLGESLDDVIKESGGESGEGLFPVVEYAILDWERPLIQDLIVSEGTKVPCSREHTHAVNLLQIMREHIIPTVDSETDDEGDEDEDEEEAKPEPEKKEEVSDDATIINGKTLCGATMRETYLTLK